METDIKKDKSTLDKLYFKIGDVAKLASVNSSVIRFWETEFSGIAPIRTKSGQRLYNKKKVEKILVIKDLLYNKRFTIAGAKKYLKNINSKKLPSQVETVIKQVKTELYSIKEILQS